MGHKIFISYKFKDNQVYRLNDNYFTTVRDYVNILEDYIRNMSDNIYKAESEGEDLSYLSDDTIWEKLKDKIVDSTLTIVIISKGMREVYKTDKDQWIPWEVRYSLLETKRKNSNGDPKYALRTKRIFRMSKLRLSSAFLSSSVYCLGILLFRLFLADFVFGMAIK